MRRLAVLALSLALGACSAFSLGGEAEVDLTVLLWPEEARALGFTVEAGERTLSRDDFRDVDGRQFDAGSIEVHARPTEITCTVVSEGAASTVGTLRLHLEAGWRYRVWCAVGTAEEALGCFGCRGSEAFALDPALGLAPGDSLYLIWGGDPIHSPVHY